MLRTVWFAVTGRSPATDGTSLCSGPSVQQRHTGWSWRPPAWGLGHEGTANTRTYNVMQMQCVQLNGSRERDASSVTCSVLMHALMSLSVFSHRDIRVPVSVFIPCRSEICKQRFTPTVICKVVLLKLCTPVRFCVCWPLPVSVWVWRAESGGTSGGRPAVWEAWELGHNWKKY